MDTITPPPAAPATVTPPTKEVLIAQWKEVEHPKPTLQSGSRSRIILGGLVIVAILILLGWWQKESGFYLGAVAVLAIAVNILTQEKRSDPALEVALTDQRVLIGRREYQVSTIAGFWLEADGGYLTINFEMKKHTLLPVSCLFATGNPDEARATLLKILPEVEGRPERLSENIAKYFRF